MNDTISIEDRIRASYESLAAEPAAWVLLSRLRADLAELTAITGTDIPRADIDATILKMVLAERTVRIIPEFNQKTLTPADRAASIRMGGENQHLLSIGHR